VIDFRAEEKGCYTDHGVSGYGVAVRLTRKILMDDDFVRKMAEEMMLSIAGNCTELGARAIGHIKSHVRTDAGTVKADTIGVAHGSYSSGKFDHPVKELFMAINSIVQGIPEEAVKAATLEGLHEIAESHHMNVIKEKEHTYFDEFDFAASKADDARQRGNPFAEDESEEDL